MAVCVCLSLLTCSQDPEYLKGFYRRGSAQIALSHFKEAKQDFLYVCREKPSDKVCVSVAQRQ
ncbi:MAG: hypothetical protein P4L40_00095 [Terracidiphilus sp.]|nr:hypothetical protein [Terracidiphilus sp.]